MSEIKFDVEVSPKIQPSGPGPRVRVVLGPRLFDRVNQLAASADGPVLPRKGKLTARTASQLAAAIEKAIKQEQERSDRDVVRTAREVVDLSMFRTGVQGAEDVLGEKDRAAVAELVGILRSGEVKAVAFEHPDL